jgi:hypothetical protein
VKVVGAGRAADEACVGACATIRAAEDRPRTVVAARTTRRERERMMMLVEGAQKMW